VGYIVNYVLKKRLDKKDEKTRPKGRQGRKKSRQVGFSIAQLKGEMNPQIAGEGAYEMKSWGRSLTWGR